MLFDKRIEKKSFYIFYIFEKENGSGLDKTDTDRQGGETRWKEEGKGEGGGELLLSSTLSGDITTLLFPHPNPKENPPRGKEKRREKGKISPGESPTADRQIGERGSEINSFS